MTEKWKNRTAGAAAGLVNGLFGGGGGMVLLPLLTRWGGLKAKDGFATCVAVILPVCCVSAAVYLWQVRPGLDGPLSVSTADRPTTSTPSENSLIPTARPRGTTLSPTWAPETG